MNIQRFAIALGLGLGLALALLWLLGSSTTPVTAAPVLSPAEGPALSPEQDPAERPLSDATPIHYVATSGTDDGDCSTPAGACRTIQYAVGQAGEGDEVRIATGVYTDINTYDWMLQVVYIDKTVTVRGGYTTTNWSVSNPISYPTTLDAQGQGRVLYIIGNIRPVIEGLRITGGNGEGLGCGGFYNNLDGGGGVCIRYAIASLSNNWILANRGTYGGGVHLYESPSTLTGNTISFNTADNEGIGGGLYIGDSNATLVGNTINANIAHDNGGGLNFSGGTLTLSGNTFTNNQANAGGGLYMNRGGGIFNGNVFVRNTAKFGGGLFLGSVAKLTNNIVADNQADTAGGGLYICSYSGNFRHTTIARNRAGDGSGVSVYCGNSVFTNTVLVSHTVGIVVTAGSAATLEATLWGDGAWANSIDWGGDGTIVTGTVNLWGDPVFLNPDGGDYHIESTSAAYDAGVHAAVSGDIDNQVRPMDQGPDIGADEHPGVGLALVKVPSALYVTPDHVFTYTIIISSTGNVTGVVLTDTLDARQRAIDATSSAGGCTVADSNWGGNVVCTPGVMVTGTVVVITLTTEVSTTVTPEQKMINTVAVTANETKNKVEAVTYGQNCHVRINDDVVEYMTVQAAVDAANPGDLLKVAGVCLGASERTGLRQQVYLDKSLTIRGGYTTTNWTASYPLTQPTTLDALGQGRVLYIAEGISPTVEGLHITGGNATGLRGATWLASAVDLGGGVYASNATVTINNAWVSRNTADYGGGICLTHSAAPLLNDNTISDNSTRWRGGGLYLYDTPSTILSGNIISGNTTHEGRGAGLYMIYGDNATLRDNIFSGNAIQAPWSFGGGLYLSDSDNVTFSSNIISSNTAPAFGGGGMYMFSCNNATFSGNIVNDNVAEVNSGGLYLAVSDNATFIGNTISGNSSRGGSGGGLGLSGSNNATLSGNTITSNTNHWGGGLYLYASDATLTNNIIADNQADDMGSGIYIQASSSRLLHTTIARNIGSNGTGVHVHDGSTVTLTNTILVSHTAGIAATDGSTVTLEATLWGDGTWANDADWSGTGTIMTGTINIWGDPAFLDPDSGDYHIGPGSAALNIGVSAGVNEDIDGDLRPMGPGFDLGADELTSALVVTKQATPHLVLSGTSVTYTLQVTNAGYITLTATITDILPNHVTPSGVLTWTVVIPAPGGVWSETIVVTAETGYVGPLTNVVQVATAEGATGVYTATSTVVPAPVNHAPHIPSNPTPAHDASGVPLTQTLRWQGGDPDGDPVTYTVAFGASNPPPFAATTTLTSYTPALIAGTTYYWGVTATDGISTSVSPTWHFATVEADRYFVYLPVVIRDGP